MLQVKGAQASPAREEAVLLQGNEACVEGALAAGLDFFAGYPITPSSEIAELLAARLPRRGGKFIQMEDEIAGIAAVIGAALGGAQAMTATSGPGFSLKQENIGFAAMAEVPCVIVDSQRVGPSTGMPTSPAQGDLMQARWGSHGDRPVVAYYPASVAETYRLAIRAFATAERLRLPVILLLDEVISHMRERVTLKPPAEDELPKRRQIQAATAAGALNDYPVYRADAEEQVPFLPDFGRGYRFHVTGLTHDEKGFPTENRVIAGALHQRLVEKVRKVQDELAQAEVTGADPAETLVVAAGGVARSAQVAVEDLRRAGYSIALFRPITIWPFPEKAWQSRVAAARRVVVVEMNMGQLYYVVDRLTKRAPVELCNQVNGELITPEQIVSFIKG
ncbi:MAG: 2-oxoglutarate/2-oxoacid ferredoxin oxidoreductase subunit alpha [Bacillota bacterium]|nr:2-oxoglutarate/2-oxoacid ferredoxin oxidoreductase subunit alpha [Bacillota bacterium]